MMSEFVLLIVDYDGVFEEGCPLSFDSYREAFQYAYQRWRFERSQNLDLSCYWLHSSSGWKCISNCFFDMAVKI